jgi:methionyl-tRNA formyltransferase
MKFILITSQVTYLDDNYQTFLDSLIKKFPDKLAGIVIIKNISPQLFAKILWLYKTGCFITANTLFKNCAPYKLSSKLSIAKKLNIPILKTNDINGNTTLNWIKDKNIDIIISARVRNIFNQELLQIPKIGSINIHHGLLPVHRGILCDLNALYNKEDAGFTIHQMISKIDDGIILHKQIVCNKCHITDYQKYLKKSSALEVLSIANVLHAIEQEQTLYIKSSIPNKSKKIIYHKTPTSNELMYIKKSGIIL